MLLYKLHGVTEIRDHTGSWASEKFLAPVRAFFCCAGVTGRRGGHLNRIYCMLGTEYILSTLRIILTDDSILRTQCTEYFVTVLTEQG